MTNNTLTEKLLLKSQEAFILGIEVYNKPTIRYRVEGFSFFICNAWELLLKAILIKTKGEKSIYYKNNNDRTLNLENCIKLIMTNDKDPVRLNLEQIINLRNTSTHFITEDKRHEFNKNHFDLFVKFYNLKSNPDYCYKYELGKHISYSYSEKALNLIFEEIKKDPEHIIQSLKNNIKK